MAGSRIGAVLLTLAILALGAMTPNRYRIAPYWLLAGAPILMIAAMALRALTPRNDLWRRAERAMMFVAVGLAFVLNTLNLIDVVDAMIYEPQTLKADALFFTAIGIWLTNFLVFSLIYWLIDRGGPEARTIGDHAYPDFEFPAMTDPACVPPDWKPSIADYLFIGFTTNTAFSPTEAMPISARAKCLMIVQSLIALADVVVVAARAIGL